MEKVLRRKVQEWSARNNATVFARIFAMVSPKVSKLKDVLSCCIQVLRQLIYAWFRQLYLGNTIAPKQQPRIISTTIIASTAAPPDTVIRI